MSQEKDSKLERYSEQLEEWFELDGIALREAQKRLAELGCKVGLSSLSRWWNDRKATRSEAQFLAMVKRGARQCRLLEKALADGGAPELELLIKLHRSLILNLSTQGEKAPNLLRLAAELMKPVLGWASLQEKRRIRELAEQKYRDQVAAQKAAIERAINAAKASGGISQETLEHVERELKLL